MNFARAVVLAIFYFGAMASCHAADWVAFVRSSMMRVLKVITRRSRPPATCPMATPSLRETWTTPWPGHPSQHR